jgi:hypothetical protein
MRTHLVVVVCLSAAASLSCGETSGNRSGSGDRDGSSSGASAASGSSGGSGPPAGADAGGGDAGTGTGTDGGTNPGPTGVENSTSSCTVSAVPAVSALATNAKLPDPFQSMDGTRITRKDQWNCRRAEIMAEAQQYELGTKPPKPSMVSGSFANNAITVNVTDSGKSGSFTATVTYPATGDGPFPAMIGIDGVVAGPTQLTQEGVALITFPASTVAQQTDGTSRGKGVFYSIYGTNATAGAMIAWAWGVSRLIDVIEQTPAARIDPKRLGVNGCSRDGKGALIVGAFDERIALTVPEESGSGGAAGWRISDFQVSQGTQVQTLSEITGENVWFTSAFSQFNNTATKLPFDHHMIEGLVAPRALLVIENTSQVWLGNVSTFNDSVAANMIWQGLGIADHMGVTQVGDHAHCMWNGSQQAQLDAYVQKFLIGGGIADTNILQTDAATYCPQSGTCTAYGFDQARWVDWTVPTLQ